MMLDLKNINRWDLLDERRMLVFINVEDFIDVLDAHSPNLLINYLNDRYALDIPQLPGKRNRKEVRND